MEEAESYYIRRRGRTEGPWPVSKVKSEIALRKLGRHHEISSDGAHWRRAGELGDLFPAEVKRKLLDRPQATESVSATAQLGDGSTPVKAEWHYYVEEHDRRGPLTTDQLVDAILMGQCPLDAMVWKDGFGDWVPVEDVAEIMSALEAFQRTAGSDTAATRMVQTAPIATRSPKALAAFVTGCISMLLSWVPILGFLGLVAVVLGGVSIREVGRGGGQPRDKYLAIGGIVTGALGMLFGLMTLIAVAVYFLI